MTGSEGTPVTHYVCRKLIECVAWICEHMMAGDLQRAVVWPKLLQIIKETPAPKHGQAASPLDKSLYRKISVSSILGRVLRLKHARLDPLVEGLGIRAATQCGFRKGQGTLDAICALHHCICKARFQHDKL